jgi:hypothetical protein
MFPENSGEMLDNSFGANDRTAVKANLYALRCIERSHSFGILIVPSTNELSVEDQQLRSVGVLHEILSLDHAEIKKFALEVLPSVKGRKCRKSSKEKQYTHFENQSSRNHEVSNIKFIALSILNVKYLQLFHRGVSLLRLVWDEITACAYDPPAPSHHERPAHKGSQIQVQYKANYNVCNDCTGPRSSGGCD